MLTEIYFQDIEPLNEIPINKIQNITRADDLTKKEHSIQVQTKDRTFYFFAATEDERELWIQELQALFHPSVVCDSAVEQRLLGRAVPFISSDSEEEPQTPPASASRVSMQEEIPLQPVDTPVTELFGFLHKAGGKKYSNHSSWQKRWVALNERGLQYYRKQTDLRPAGEIPYLSIISVEPADELTKRPASFGIAVPGRTYYFYANSVALRADWIAAIHRWQQYVYEAADNCVVNDSEELEKPKTPKIALSSRNGDLVAAQGYLWKTPGSRGRKPGNWQKRWFVLTDHGLYYYKHAKVRFLVFVSKCTF